MNIYFILREGLVLGVSIVIVFFTFKRLRERSLAIRGLMALGFLGMFFAVVYAFLRQNPATLIGMSGFSFGVVAVVEMWGRKD